MNSISTNEHDFFVILRAGLWGKSSETLSANPNWDYIYAMGIYHKVNGIIVEGISVMGIASEVPSEIFDRLLTEYSYIAIMNERVNNVQAKLCSVLTDNNIPYAIIKGQAVAQAYQKPLIRLSGDIDFLVAEEDFDKVNHLFAEFNHDYEFHHEADLHHALHIDDVWVENHAMAKSYFTKRLDRVLEQERKRMFSEKDFDHYIYNGMTISMPNPEYHALFILGHILRHMTTEGISLKQLCDWVMFLHANNSNIDHQRLSVMIRDAHFDEVWHQFSLFANYFFGSQVQLQDAVFSSESHTRSNDTSIRIWRSIQHVLQLNDQSRQRKITNFWLHYLSDYRYFILKNNVIWSISKQAFFERLWTKFAPLPMEFIKRILHLKGSHFRTDRFQS